MNTNNNNNNALFNPVSQNLSNKLSIGQQMQRSASDQLKMANTPLAYYSQRFVDSSIRQFPTENIGSDYKSIRWGNTGTNPSDLTQGDEAINNFKGWGGRMRRVHFKRASTQRRNYYPRRSSARSSAHRAKSIHKKIRLNKTKRFRKK